MSSTTSSTLTSSGSFGARLRAATDARGTLCVGIDPHAALLSAWDLPDDADGLERFARTVVEALADRVAVLKPQSAFFERHGSKGIAVLERVLADIRAAGAIALLDVKRGDIGSTVQGYADAYLRAGAPLRADAVTATPFLGFDSLRPLYDTAIANGCGVFVLTMTSNPEGAEVQRAVAGGRSVAGSMLDRIAEENADSEPLGSIGSVVGANVRQFGADTGEDFVKLNGPVLAPGYGAQGGTTDDLARIFGPAIGNVLPSTSREVLSAGPSVDALRAAAARTAEALPTR